MLIGTRESDNRKAAAITLGQAISATTRWAMG
jgi:hypothetical protein